MSFNNPPYYCQACQIEWETQGQARRHRQLKGHYVGRLFRINTYTNNL